MSETFWAAGFGKADITVFEPGVCMFGWGQPWNMPRDVAAPLYARALAVRCPRRGVRLVYVCADLGFISQHLRQLVVDGARVLGLGEHDVMLTATHTRSGPNGYSAYLFYSVAAPGFSRRVAEALADGILRAIRQALGRLAPARLHAHEGTMPLVEPVAFNRALTAYNANTDVEPVAAGRSDEALDRRLTVLRVESPEGRPRGMVCWFAVHGTSVHSDNTRIHPDNKGIAAARCERFAADQLEVSDEPFIAIFAQEAAGDVTPNYRWSEQRKMLIGRHDNDFDSAEFSGEIQARQAWRLFQDAANIGHVLSDQLDGRIRYSDFSRITVAPEFAAGREGETTATACVGLAFAAGTLEGPGPAFPLRGAFPALSALTHARRRLRDRNDWRAIHGPKVRLIDLGHGSNGRLLTWLSAQPPGLRCMADSRVRYYARVLQDRCMLDRPWVPQVLPVQVFRLGALCIVGLPVEPTTHSGRRLRAALGSVMGSHGVRHIVINGYANAYASYVTTHEEYSMQLYEGASTLFGPWTLAAFCTELQALARAMLAGGAAPDDLGAFPARFGDQPLPPAR
jgi:neutral ceramidase